MRNTNDTHTRHARIWNSEIGDDLSIGSRAGTRRARPLRSNFRFGIFGSIRNPFPRSLERATPGTRSIQRECGYSVRSLPSLASSSHPRSLGHPPRIQFYCSCSSVTETRAREKNRRGAAQSEALDRTRSGEGGRPDFQMDINSSAWSTPRSSLITPLQLLSLIKASGCWWVLRQAAAATTRRKNAK